MTELLKKENTFGLLRKKKTSVKKNRHVLITADIASDITSF
jgi:hypothetical protein